MPTTLDLLNDLLAVQHCSLPRYLTYVSPWTGDENTEAAEVVTRIAEDQQRMSERIAETIYDRGGMPDAGDFPMEFTDTHFLALDYLLRELVYYQKQDVAAIEEIVSQLGGDADAKALAEETLGAEKAHLEDLERLLAKQPA